MSRKRAVHGTGIACRSDGNDTNCGIATADPGSLEMTDDDTKVTCKLCLRVMQRERLDQ